MMNVPKLYFEIRTGLQVMLPNNILLRCFHDASVFKYYNDKFNFNSYSIFEQQEERFSRLRLYLLFLKFI